MALIDTLGSAVSALQSFNTGLDTVANNIANIDTTAYKGASTSFADTFNGAGVQISSTTTNFGQGSLVSTGVSTNLAISGNGYFLVQDNSNPPNIYATRDGGFSFNSSGTLVNEEGYAVLGLSSPTTSGGSGGGTPAPITVANTDSSGGTLQSVSISPTGEVVGSYSDGTTSTPVYIAMQNFTNPSALVSEGDNLYTNLAAANGGTTAYYTASTNGMGSIQSGMLEQSNVDLTSEFASMITLQRAFEANSRVMTTSDTILQDIINMKQP